MSESYACATDRMRADERRLHSVVTGSADQNGGYIYGPALVVLDIEYDLRGLHDRSRRISETIVPQLPGARFEALRINDRVAAFAIEIAAQPDRNVLWIGNLVTHVLVTRDLRKIKRYLCADIKGEQCSHCGNHHEF